MSQKKNLATHLKWHKNILPKRIIIIIIMLSPVHQVTSSEKLARAKIRGSSYHYNIKFRGQTLPRHREDDNLDRYLIYHGSWS